MDICRWSFGNTSTIISFRWLIILMIYIATLILAICTEFMKDLTWENNLNEKTNTTNINDNLDDEQQQQQSTVIMVSIFKDKFLINIFNINNMVFLIEIVQ